MSIGVEFKFLNNVCGWEASYISILQQQNNGTYLGEQRYSGEQMVAVEMRGQELIELIFHPLDV